MPPTKPPYPPEFRRETVQLTRTSEHSIARVARDLGISNQTLHNWIKEADVDDVGGREGLTTDEREELRRLRRENRTLLQEREILKKPRPSSPGERGAVTDAYRFIAAEKANHPISLMSRLLGVSRQAFQAWERRPPSQRALKDAFPTERIREIHRPTARLRRSADSRRAAHGTGDQGLAKSGWSG